MRGDLPWQNVNSDIEGAQIKKQTVVSVLCHDLPEEWMNMMNTARACEFEAKPDYEYYSKSFIALGAKPGQKESFQWQTTTPKVNLMENIIYVLFCLILFFAHRPLRNPFQVTRNLER